MKTLEIVGFKRTETGSKNAQELRSQGYVPGVIYGGEENVHFYSPMILFRDLVYTPDVFKVLLNIEGTVYETVLKEVQFHPVSEVLLHTDFYLLKADKAIKMDIPVRVTGSAVGVQKGGRLAVKLRSVKVRALPANLPDFVEIDVTNLDLGKTARVSDLKKGDFEILNNPLVSVASVDIPRALRQAQAEG